MAHLTDAQHKTVGHTVLYVPDEGFVMEDSHAHKDKELVQRLEGNKKVSAYPICKRILNYASSGICCSTASSLLRM